MASIPGRGAQVRLDGDAQKVARGGGTGRLIDNLEAKRALELAGTSANGYTPDGSTLSGQIADDEALTPGGVVPDLPAVTQIATDAATTRVDQVAVRQDGSTSMTGPLRLAAEQGATTPDTRLAAPKGWVRDGENFVNLYRFRPAGHQDTDRDTDWLRSAADSGENIFVPSSRRRIFQIEDTIRQAPGTTWIGPAVGGWPLSFRATRDMKGAVIVLVAQPTTTVRIPFISDVRTAGGVVANPSSINARDAQYSLGSLMNEDANATTGDGATPKDIRVAWHVLPGQHSAMQDLRIMLSYDGTATLNGHQRRFDYDSFSFLDPAPAGLGINADIGVFNDNGFHFSARRLQSVGYWRQYGLLQNTAYTNDGTNPAFGDQGTEHCLYEGCTFQGMRGFAVRGADTYRVMDVGPDWVEFPWAANHTFRFADTKGWFRLNGASTLSGRYTGQQKIGDRVRLTGLDRDLVAAGVQANGLTGIFPSRYSRTVASTKVKDGEISGMFHCSYERMTEVPDVVSGPSTCVEVSGRGIRGVTFDNVFLRGFDDVAFHLHETSNVLIMGGCGFENVGTVAVPYQGFRFIASPDPRNNTRVATPASSTEVAFDTVCNLRLIDLRPGSGVAPARFAQVPADTGLFDPLILRGPLLFQDSLGITGGVGRDRGIKDNSGTLALYYQGSSGDVITRSRNTDGTYTTRARWNDGGKYWEYTANDIRFLDESGTIGFRLGTAEHTAGRSIVPDATNTVFLGRVGRSWSVVNTERLDMGDTTSTGTGSQIRHGSGHPEASVNAKAGSLYLHRNSATDGRLFVKASGDLNNTGWAPIKPIYLATLSTLPAANSVAAGTMYQVSDRSFRIATSDGTAWRDQTGAVMT